MAWLPVISGLIKRRLLINFRSDPAVVQRLLPEGFRPKLHRGYAVVGICLIRLERVRPRGLPVFMGIASENAAHRIAVEWSDDDGGSREGVFIPRRDTNSQLNALAGGRVFPGEHHRSRFGVRDDKATVSIEMASADEAVHLFVSGRESDGLPDTSCFRSVGEASRFFEPGSVGYSVTKEPDRLDGIELRTVGWEVRAFDVDDVDSSFFLDPLRFPSGSISFDHGLIMRDVEHTWHAVDDFLVRRSEPTVGRKSSPG
jgi:hypothetical protein